jgi:hypothetical protein
VQAVFDLLADRPLGGQPCRSWADSSFDSLGLNYRFGSSER